MATMQVSYLSAYGAMPPTPPSPALGAPANVAADFVGGKPGRRSHRPTAASAERLAARLRARPNLAGRGEVTSPLFSITSILNATSYKGSPGPVNVEIVDYH